MTNKENLLCSAYVLGTMLDEVMMCLEAELTQENKYLLNKCNNMRKTIKVFLSPINRSIKKSNDCDYIEQIIGRQHDIYENISKLQLEDFEYIEKEVQDRLNKK